METLGIVLLVLFYISGVVLIVGLIRPGYVLRWGKVKRIRVFYIFFPLMLLFLVLSAFFVQEAAMERKATENKAKVLNSELTSVRATKDLK
jgi:hypothetical protein